MTAPTPREVPVVPCSLCGGEGWLRADVNAERIAAIARREPLDVERLRWAIRYTVDATTQRRVLPYLEAIAAEYARLEAER